MTIYFNFSSFIAKMSFLSMLLLFSFGAQAQDENLQLVQTNLNKLFPEKFQVAQLSSTDKGDGDKLLSGSATFAGDVQTNITVTVSGKSIKEFAVSFPLGAGFNIGDVQRVCGVELRNVLPRSVSTSAGILISDFTLKLEGGNVRQFNLNLKSKNWAFLDFGSLKMENVLLGIVYNPSSGSKISGTLMGDIVLGNVRLNTTMSIPTKKEDWKIEANYNPSAGALTIGNVLKSLGGDALVSSMLTPELSSFFGNQTLPAFSLECSPFKKEFKMNTGGGIGAIEMSVASVGGKPGGFLSYSPPSGFQFSNLHSSLGWLDGIKMPLDQVKLVVGNKPHNVGTHRVSKGLAIQSKIKLPKEIENLLGGKGADLELFGNLASLSDFTISANLNLNADLGEGIKMESIGLGLKSAAVAKQFFVDGKILFPVDNSTNLRFGMKMGVEPTSSSFVVGLNLLAVNDKNEDSEWKEPFGVPYVGIGNLGGDIGLNPATIVKSLNLNGDLRLGKIPTANELDKRLRGTVALGLDITDPSKTTIQGTLNNANFASVIRAFDPSIKLEGPIKKALESEIENLMVDIRPTGGYLEVSGSVNIFGKAATLAVKADKSSGISASGSMDPIELKAGSFTIIGITGNGSPKPTFAVDFSADPKIKIKGAIEVLGKAVSGDIDISKDGFTAEVEGSLFKGLEMKAKLKGSSLENLDGMMVDLELKQEIMSMVKNEVTNFIKKSSGEAEKDIKKAQDKIRESKRNSNDVEKFFLDLGDAFLGAVNEIQGVAAIAGMAITKGLFETLDIKSVKFSGAASSLNSSIDFAVKVKVFGSEQNFNIGINLNTTDVAGVIGSLGKGIGEGILDGLDFFGGEWDGIKGELGEFAQDFTKVLGDAVKGMEEAFNAASDLFEGLAKELDNLWNGEDYEKPKSPGALAEVKPGIVHYSITINKIVVNKADDGISVGGIFSGDSRDRELELYGPISLHIQGETFSPSGTNGIFWSKNRDQDVTVGNGGTININNTKHFYAKQGTTVYATIISRLWEYDDGPKLTADDKIYGSTLKTMSSGTQDIVLTCNESSGDNPSQLTIYGKITKYPMMTATDVRNAILSDNVNNLQSVLRKGGDLNSLKPLDEAVNNNKPNMVKFFLANGHKPSTNNLNTAVNSSAYNRDMVRRLILRGAPPTDAILDKMIKKKDHEIVAQIVERGKVPTLAQYNWVIGQKDYVLAGYLLDHGVKPTANELKAAVGKKDKKAATLVINKGVKGDVNLLNSTIKAKNIDMFDLLINVCPVQQSSLSEAAQANSVPMYKGVLAKGVKADGASLVYSIDRDNTEITKLGLENGAPPTSGLRHAISKQKRNFIDLCLDYGADPNEALSYAVTNKDLAFATTLITKYGAAGDKLLSHSLSDDKVEFAKLALTEGKANPTKQLKAVTDPMKESIANLLLDYGADPNEGMVGTIKNDKPVLLARLIDLGADVKNPEYVKKAVFKNSLKMVALLVENGASPDPGMESSVREKKNTILDYLLSQGAKTKGHIPMAIYYKNTEGVSILLKYGADPNEGMKEATEKNLVPILKMLLEYGGNPKGYMAVPAKNGYTEVVKLLVAYGGDPQEGLKPGAMGNRTDIVNFLLTQGAIPSDLLKYPCSAGNDKMVLDLCKFGDDPQKGVEANAKAGHVPVAKILVQYGARITDYKYIKLSTINHRSTLVAYMIQLGADATTLGMKGESLLHLACDKLGGAETVKVLLDGGAKAVVNSVETTLGNTPLHVAGHVKAKKGVNNLKAVEYLVAAGANVNAINTKTKNGKTVLAYSPNPKIKKFLKANGAVLLAKKARALMEEAEGEK